MFAPSGAEAARMAAVLRLWGYDAQAAGRSAGSAVAATVSYREGLRRAALALAGDLGLRTAEVVADDSASAGLTLELHK